MSLRLGNHPLTSAWTSECPEFPLRIDFPEAVERAHSFPPRIIPQICFCPYHLGHVRILSNRPLSHRQDGSQQFAHQPRIFRRRGSQARYRHARTAWTLKDRLGKIASAQVGTGEPCIAQVRFDEDGGRQISVTEIRVPEIGRFEVCRTQNRTHSTAQRHDDRTNCTTAKFAAI